MMMGQADDAIIFMSSWTDSQAESISHRTVNLARYLLKAKGSVGPFSTIFTPKGPVQLREASDSVSGQKEVS